MKRLLSIIAFLFCVSILSYGQRGGERPIDGYFLINNSRTVEFFMEDDLRTDYTEVAVKAGVPFMIRINKPISGPITWQTLSSVTGTNLFSTGDDGKMLTYHTSEVNGTLILLGTDSAGNQIMITVYIIDAGLS